MVMLHIAPDTCAQVLLLDLEVANHGLGAKLVYLLMQLLRIKFYWNSAMFTQHTSVYSGPCERKSANHQSQMNFWEWSS